MIAPRSSHRIRSLSIIGGFLDGARFDLSNGLNCVIGARGTGKTTAAEFVGYALDSLPSREHAAEERKRIETLVKRNLNGGRIELEIEAADGTTYRVTRTFGEEPIVLDEAGAPAAVNLKSGLFRAEVFSQNAVESIADRPRFQLDLLDSFAGPQIAELFSREQQLISTLKANAHQIIPLERELAAIRDELTGLTGIEGKLKVFGSLPHAANAEINEAHRLKGIRDRESRAVQRLLTAVSEYRQAQQSAIGCGIAEGSTVFDPESVAGPNQSILQALVSQFTNGIAEAEQHFQHGVTSLEQLERNLSEQAEGLARQHQLQELAFRTTIEKHQLARQQAAERTDLERRRNQLLARQQQQTEIAQRLAELSARRQEFLQRLSELRDQRFEIRNAVAIRINHELSPTIRVTMLQYGNSEAYRQLLESRLKGASLRHGIVAQKLAVAIPPAELTAVIRTHDAAPLIDRAELNSDQAAKSLQALDDPEFLFTLETVELDDQPRIELKDGQDYKETSRLSTGQKCTTILPILLLESDSALIVDQPEDNLDNRFIFQTVVESIRRVKAKRQLILVTHNPNIPVLGEADHIVVLESDGVQGRVTREGNVDHCKAEIVTLLEGGAEAFRRRGERYGQ